MIYLVGSNLEFEGVKTLVLNEIKFNKMRRKQATKSYQASAIAKIKL